MRGKEIDRKKRKAYCSIAEFEQDFFPKAYRERQARKVPDSHSIGVNLAKESFQRIRQEAQARHTLTGEQSPAQEHISI